MLDVETRPPLRPLPADKVERAKARFREAVERAQRKGEAPSWVLRAMGLVSPSDDDGGTP